MGQERSQGKRKGWGPPVVVERDLDAPGLVELLGLEVDQLLHGQGRQRPRRVALQLATPRELLDSAEKHLRLLVVRSVAVRDEAVRRRLVACEDLVGDVRVLVGARAPALYNMEMLFRAMRATPLGLKPQTHTVIAKRPPEGTLAMYCLPAGTVMILTSPFQHTWWMISTPPLRRKPTCLGLPSLVKPKLRGEVKEVRWGAPARSLALSRVQYGRGNLVRRCCFLSWCSAALPTLGA